jgi:hypothetical protein
MHELIALRFLGPASPPPDEQSVVPVDLSAWPLLVGRLGEDAAALLYLLLRAVRVRSGAGQATLHALAWPLRTSEARVRRGLDALARADLLAFAWERTRTGEGIVFEFPAQTPLHPPTRAWPPSSARVHALPTIWFVQALPLLGRDAFALYLALLAREPTRRARTELRLSGVAASIGIVGAHRQRRAVRRLRRFGALQIDAARGPFAPATLRDLPPPTPRERRVLRLLAIPFLPTALRELAALAAALVAAALVLLTLALHARHR